MNEAVFAPFAVRKGNDVGLMIKKIKSIAHTETITVNTFGTI